jgi:predicted DsbA family dithiol-disulfide isomerase
MPPTVLYGDFSCPWSYLAHSRLLRLRATGTTFELRAVEHDPWRARPSRSSDQALACLSEELDRVTALLLPGESLPLAPPHAVPHTRAAVSGYAEAFGAGVADLAAPRLFDAYWTRGTDLSSPAGVRSLLADAVVTGTSPSDPLRRWGHAVDVTGAPMTTTAWRLVRDWRDGWTAMEKEVVPVLVLPDGEHVYGVDAVEHLGRLVWTSGVDPSAELTWPEPGPRPPLDGYGRVQVLYPATAPVW